MSAPRRTTAGVPRRMTAALLAVVLGILPAACGRTGQVLDAGAAPTRPAPVASAPGNAASPAPPSASPSSPASTAATATPPGRDGQDSGGQDSDGAGVDGEHGDGTSADGDPAADVTSVSVYFTRGERVAPVTRTVARVPRIGSAAIEQLLGGPTAAEAAAGHGTQIPAGTRLRGLTISDGLAVVDLSGEFETGGGTLAMTLRLAQVTCTLDAFPTVDGVRFAIDGEVVDVFSGDGLVVDEPVTCSDYTDSTGSSADGTRR